MASSHRIQSYGNGCCRITRHGNGHDYPAVPTSSQAPHRCHFSVSSSGAHAALPANLERSRTAYGLQKMLRSLIRIFTCVAIMAAVLAIIPTASFAESPSTAESATLKRDSLMPVAFPGWRPGDKGVPTNPKVPSSEIVKLSVGGKTSRYFVEPLAVTRLDAKHAAMIASTIPIDPESGGPDYGCGGSNYCPDYSPIGAYIFTRGMAGWALTRRADLVTTVTGYDVDHFKVQRWPGHGLVVAFATTYGYQSEYVTTLTMISLQPNRVIPLLNTSLSTGADFIDGGELGCEDVLNPKYNQPKNVTINYANCASTLGQWRFEGNRIRLTFRWASRGVDGNGRLAPLKSWKTRAELEWTGGELKLVKGNLPDFGI